MLFLEFNLEDIFNEKAKESNSFLSHLMKICIYIITGNNQKYLFTLCFT